MNPLCSADPDLLSFFGYVAHFGKFAKFALNLAFIGYPAPSYWVGAR